MTTPKDNTDLQWLDTILINFAIDLPDEKLEHRPEYYQQEDKATASAKVAIAAKLASVELEARYSAEVWRQVAGYGDNYEVSSAGRVRSKPRQRSKGGLLQLIVQPTGYIALSLSDNGVIKNSLVHRLVAQTFVPNPDKKPCVNHIDGNKTNNCVSNLEWSTYQENELHSYRTLGKVNSQARLNAKQIREIKSRLAEGENNTSISNDYGVDHSLISQIKRGIIWKTI